MPAPTLVVAGFRQLADALRASGYGGRVVPVASTSELRDAIRTELAGVSKSELVFLFADNLVVDTPQTLDLLVAKLTGAGWRVIILEASANGPALVESYPRAGLVPAPHTLNKALAALAGVGVGGLEPRPDGHSELSPDITSVAVDDGWTGPADGWAAPEAPQAAGSPSTPNAGAGGLSQRAQNSAATPSGEAVGDGWSSTAPASDDGWSTPAAAPTDGWSTPAPAAPVPSGGDAGGWGEPAAGTQVGWGAPRPVDDLAGGHRGPAGGLVARSDTARPGAGEPERRGKVIVVCAPKGGVGKSSVVLNLGGYLGRRLQGTPRTVCVVDANFQQADSGKYLGTYKPNIADIARSTTLNQQVVARNMVHRSDLNLSVLLGPSTPREASPHYINGDLYRSVITVLRGMFDYILIDTPVAELHHNIFDQFVLPEADFLIVTVTPNSTTLINAYLYLRTICAPRPAGGRDFDPTKIGILLNRAEEDVGFDEADVQEELAAYQFLGSIPETKEWKRANNENRLVATMNYTELNTAFARVLYAATRDPVLEDALVAPDLPTRGLLGRFGFRRRK